MIVPRLITGDIVHADAEAIVNAWNRNIIPWWLLLPQGVSGAIKKHAGTAPFRELARHGPIPLGDAVITSAGRLPYKGIIHVAGIDMLWRASERSIRASTRNAVRAAASRGWRSIALPLIGSGSGGFDAPAAGGLISDELSRLEDAVAVAIVSLPGRP